MWIEKYLDAPLVTTNAGFADEKKLLRNCVFVSKKVAAPDSRAIFPVLSGSGGQFLLDTKEQHTLIAGCTGSGKTRRVLIPAIMNAMTVSQPQARPSLFIWDVKGEIHRITGDLARKQGYEVVCIDLIHPEKSDGYSLTDLARECYLHLDEDGAENALADLAAAVSPPPAKGNSMDPFWSKVGQAAFAGTALYLLEEQPDKFTFPAVATKIMEVFEDETSVRRFMRQVEHSCGKGSSACRMIRTALSGSERTLQNVCTSVLADIGDFMKSRSMVSILQSPMPEAMRTLTEKPTVIYFKTAEVQPTLYNFGRLVFSQLYQRLVTKAGSGALDRPFEFFMDEICNGLPVEGLDRMLAMCRSKNIRLHLVVQSLNQLTACYGDKADTIRSNCGVFIVLRTTDPSTWDRVSRLSGVDIRGGSLLKPQQLARLETGRAVILSPNSLPYVARLEDFTSLQWPGQE